MANWTYDRVSEDAQTVAWRLDRLVAAGYERDEAERLATEPEVDLHLAVALLERGCSEALALRILL